MSEDTGVSSRKMTLILGGISFLMLAVFLYMVSAFFRTDRVWDETFHMSWAVQAMDCKSVKRIPVLVFRENKNVTPEFALYFPPALYAKLKPFENQLVKVKKRYAGYLREWNWGLIEFKSVEGHKVQAGWRVPQEQLVDCVFYDDERIQDEVVTSRKRMR